MTVSRHPGDAPLYLADLHYFGVPRDRWALALARARQLGASGVATPLPWAWHLVEPGRFDLVGATDPQRDLLGFIELCARLGLKVALTLAEPAASALTSMAPRAIAADAHALGESAASVAAHATLTETPIWLAALSAALRPLQMPAGPIASLRLDGDRHSVAERLREDGWAIPIVEEPAAPPGAAIYSIPRTPPRTLTLEHASRSLDSLVRADGGARPVFWRLKMTHMLLGAALDDFARARPPADLAFDDFDAPAAWADGDGIRLDIRYGETYTYLFVENTRASNYTGLLGHRGPDSSVLHLHIGLGAKRGGVVLLRGDEVAGIAIDGDASEGGWLARGLSTSAMFSSGAGGVIPSGRGVLLTAPQSGRFQLRRGEGWAEMLANRLLLSGELLPAPLQIDATHLSVPYVAEDERGQTDMYLVQPRSGGLPADLRGYLAAQLAGRAAALRRAAEQAAEAGHAGTAADLFATAAAALDTGAADLASLAEYTASRRAADRALAPTLTRLRRALSEEHARRLDGAPTDDERASWLARILRVAGHGDEHIA